MRIAVVGGGFAGLTVARALVDAGFDAHVFEAAPRAGGVLGTSRVEGYLREHAASSFLGGPPRGALALCQRLGVPVEQASPRAKKRWIFIDGKLRVVPHDPLGFVTSDLLTWRGKLDLLREPFRPRRAANAGDESMHAFAARRLGAEAARAIIAPFVTGVYAADAHAIGVAGGFPRLAALEAEGGLVRGMARGAARALWARAVGRKSVKTARGMWAPRGGLGALVDALAASLGDRMHYGAPVELLERAGTSVVVDGESWDGAVLALPAEDAATIAALRLPELATRLAVFRRAPSAVVYLGYDAASVPGASDGFGALVASGENARALGITFESVVWEDRAPAGKVLLRCIFGGGRDPEAAALDDATLIATATRDVATVLGATSAPEHTSVVRWARGVAQYPIGHREQVRAAVTAARTNRIALAGAAYNGPGLNDIAADADRVLDEVRAW